MRIFVGTSGFSYPEWKGTFYPADLPSKKFLSFYSAQFSTVEINNTFYRLPDLKTVTTWAAEVPSDFTFTLKLNQKITHIKRLKDVDDEMDRFLSVATSLKHQLGTILVQLPPNFKKDTLRLSAFLERYSGEARLAFEFRHGSWNDQEIFSLLRAHHSAWAIVEAEEQTAIEETTTSFTYMRLRKGNYSIEELEKWARWIQMQPIDVYCYLKHDEKAPVLAKQLMDLLKPV